MYINFEHMYTKGITDSQLMFLVKVSQKEYDLVDKDSDSFQQLLDAGLIEVGKIVKITTKGKNLLAQISTPNHSDEVAELTRELIELYESYGAEVDAELEVKNRLAWFVAETGFRPSVIKDAVENYLGSASKYRLALRNLIWNPPSKAFSITYSLRSSKLYDIICKEFGINPDTIIDMKNRVEFKWLRAISTVSIPRGTVYFTESRESDLERQKEIRKAFSKYLKQMT